MAGRLFDLGPYLFPSGDGPLGRGEYLLVGEGARFALLAGADVALVVCGEGDPGVHHGLLFGGRVSDERVAYARHGQRDWDLAHGDGNLLADGLDHVSVEHEVRHACGQQGRDAGVARRIEEVAVHVEDVDVDEHGVDELALLDHEAADVYHLGLPDAPVDHPRQLDGALVRRTCLYVGGSQREHLGADDEQPLVGRVGERGPLVHHDSGYHLGVTEADHGGAVCLLYQACLNLKLPDLVQSSSVQSGSLGEQLEELCLPEGLDYV